MTIYASRYFRYSRYHPHHEQLYSQQPSPEHIRPQLDLGYGIKGQSIIIFEIRPVWLRPTEIAEYDRAKATFVKATGQWKVYWIRASLKWDAYPIKPVVNTLEEFIKLVEEDKLG